MFLIIAKHHTVFFFISSKLLSIKVTKVNHVTDMKLGVDTKQQNIL